MVECQIILIFQRRLHLITFVQIVEIITDWIRDVLLMDVFVAAVLAKIISQEFVVGLEEIYHRAGRGRFILIVRHIAINLESIHIKLHKSLKIFHRVLFHLLLNLQILKIVMMGPLKFICRFLENYVGP